MSPFVIIMLMNIKHKLPLKIQSTSSNCVQTSTSQFLNFYGIKETPDEIEAIVPVRASAEGKPMGTLLADIGTWLVKDKKLGVTMHVFDAQIIDRSWKSFSQDQLLNEMEKSQINGISSARTPYAPLLIDAYVTYLQAGGKIDITKCTNDLLQSLLAKGPVMAIINFNYMYDYPRSKYDPIKKEYVADPNEGKVIEHAVVLTGFEDNNYFYNDPDYEMGGQHKVRDDVLIGAICAAQINSDNYLLSIKRPQNN
jgi:hypothetical protein